MSNIASANASYTCVDTGGVLRISRGIALGKTSEGSVKYMFQTALVWYPTCLPICGYVLFSAPNSVHVLSKHVGAKPHVGPHPNNIVYLSSEEE